MEIIYALLIAYGVFTVGAWWVFPIKHFSVLHREFKIITLNDSIKEFRWFIRIFFIPARILTYITGKLKKIFFKILFKG